MVHIRGPLQLTVTTRPFPAKAALEDEILPPISIDSCIRFHLSPVVVTWSTRPAASRGWGQDGGRGGDCGLHTAMRVRLTYGQQRTWNVLDGGLCTGWGRHVLLRGLGQSVSRAGWCGCLKGWSVGQLNLVQPSGQEAVRVRVRDQDQRHAAGSRCSLSVQSARALNARGDSARAHLGLILAQRTIEETIAMEWSKRPPKSPHTRT